MEEDFDEQLFVPKDEELVVTPFGMADLRSAQASIRAKQRASGFLPRSGFAKTYFDDPVAFVWDCFRWDKGKGPAVYQEEILSSVVEKKRVAFYGPHGIGKTSTEAFYILWFALTRDGLDWKLPTTASAWRQLTKFLWPEVRKWGRLLKYDKILRGPFSERDELLQLSLKLSTGEAFAVATDNPELIEGAHADHLAYTFDEAKAIPPPIWDSAEGAFASGDCMALAASTPGEQQGRFFQICSKKPGYEDWWVKHVSLEEAIRAGRISRTWAEQRRLQWGETSAVYQNRVLGHFADSDDTTLIPLRWVEEANERWAETMELLRTDPNFSVGPLISVGVDVSSGGADATVIAKRHPSFVSELLVTRKEDVMATAGRVEGIIHEGGDQVVAIVDSIGVGAGVVARLREGRRRVYAFNASERTMMRDSSGELGFINKRAAAWWHMREILDPENGRDVALPPDEYLIGDLTAPHWEVKSNGQIQIESKDDIRETLERSTDHGDAVVQAFWIEPNGRPAEVSTTRSRWGGYGISGRSTIDRHPDDVEEETEDSGYAVAVTTPSRWRGR